MKSFAQPREAPSQQGQEQRTPIRNPGGQSAQLAEALNQSPRVLAQARLAEALSRRQPRPEVVQRASKDEDFESKMKEEEVKADLNPPSSPSTDIAIEGTETQLPKDRQAALIRALALYQDRETQLRTSIQDTVFVQQQLPTHFYRIDEDGQIQSSKNVNGLPEVQELLRQRMRLEDSQRRIGEALALLPSLIPAFAPTGVEATPKALAESARIDKRAQVLGNLRKAYEEQFRAAQAEVEDPKFNVRNIRNDAKIKEAYTVATTKRSNAREGLTKLEAQELSLRLEAQQNKETIDQAESMISGFGSTLATADDSLNDARLTLETFAGFLKNLALQNLALERQRNNQERIAKLIQQLDENIAAYLRLGGSPDAETYDVANQNLNETSDFQDQMLRLSELEIIARIDSLEGEVSRLESQSLKLGSPIPTRPELSTLIKQESKRMEQQFLEIQGALKAAQDAGLSNLGGLKDQLSRQADLKKEAKAVKDNVSLNPRNAAALLADLLAKQEALDEEIGENPNLTAAVTRAHLKRLQQRNSNYAGLIDGLLQSGMVLDPKNLRAELARPVGPEKYASREMELGFLLAAAHNRGALVQVGRMRKEELAAALQQHGQKTTADAVSTASEGEFEADGILYFSDGSSEAVQHKTTTSRYPLEGRTHSSSERTEPELQKQLKDAANQLSGLTAQGSERDDKGRIPETPPPGARRVANLRFQNVDLPGPQELPSYTDVVNSVLSGVQRQSKGPRWRYVDEVILNFRKGRVVYRSNSNGSYQEQVEP